MKVTLSAFEIRILRYMSAIIKKNHGDCPTTISNDPEITFRGYCGEFAFCKLFNCFPDLSIEWQSNRQGTDKGDVTLNGYRIDVKTTNYRNGRLLVHKGKKVNGDYFALMVGDIPTFECKGFMSQSEMIRPERLTRFNGNLTYLAEQSELTENPTIW